MKCTLRRDVDLHHDTWERHPGPPAQAWAPAPVSPRVVERATSGGEPGGDLEELWSPSLTRYGWPTYVVTPVTIRSRTFAGLTDGRTYR